MIHFEITNSPDADVINSFNFFYNQIYLGKKSGNLLIKDKDLLGDHLMIEVIGSELLVHPQKGVEHYLINGKRATTVRKIKLNDVLTIGSTLIKILDFKETETPSRKNLLSAKLNELMNTDSPKLSVIEKLTALSKS